MDQLSSDDLVYEKKRVTLAIGNMYEFNQRHNAQMPVSRLIAKRQQKPNFAVSSEMALYWGGDTNHRIVVMPVTLNSQYVEDIARQLDVTITCLAPKCESGWVCRDLLADDEAFHLLLREIGNSEVIVMPWGATTHLYQLMDALTEHGVKIAGQFCPPRENLQIADYIDSKIGGRSILEQVGHHLPNLAVPPGYVCADRDEAATIAHSLSRHAKRPLVLKSNRGSGGRGIRLFTSPSNHELLDHSRQDFWEAMSDDEYWKGTPVIVEAAIGGGQELSLPTFEGLIGMDGVAIGKGTGKCIMHQLQYYVGIEMGHAALPFDLSTQIERIGLDIGEKMAALGYCGWYDVDFLAPTFSEVVYGSEINARLTGPVFVIEAMTRMFGQGWREHLYVRSNERLWLNHTLDDYAQVQNAFEGVRRYEGEPSGVFPIFVSAVTLGSPYIGYVLYAPNAQRAAELEADLVLRLPVRHPVSADSADLAKVSWTHR